MTEKWNNEIIRYNKCQDNPNCYFEQLKRKEQEVKELQEWKDANKPTGICETCTAKSVEDMYRYKQIVDEVKLFINRACDACKEFAPSKQSDITCRYCQLTQIRNIINKAKEVK